MTRAFTADHRRLTELRLTAQRIAYPDGGPVDAVRHLLATQAQDYRGALWSLGLRTAHPDRSAIERELEDGGIVRSWPMRGTLHVVGVQDLGWLVELTAERTERSLTARYRELGIDREAIDRAGAIADDVLDGRRLDRRELLGSFVAGGVPIDGQRGPHLLGALARERRVVLCSGTRWARWRDRMPPVEPRSREDSLDELVLRYVRGHGPATVRDLAWWAGLPLGEIRPAVGRVRDRLDAIEVGGVEYLLAPELEPAAPAAHVLPGFDEYMLGYTDRSAPLANAPFERVVPGANGMFLATVVLDGEIVATWRRSPAGSDRVVLDADRPIPRRRAPAIRAAFRRWGAFIDRPIDVEV